MLVVFAPLITMVNTLWTELAQVEILAGSYLIYSCQGKSFGFSIFFQHLLVFQMSSRKTATRRGTTKKRAQRATSNVFAMFNQDQIAEFKEARRCRR